MKQGAALRFLSTKQWALDGAYLAVMAGIAARDLDTIDLSALGEFQAVAAKDGVFSKAGYEVRNGVAVLSVSGVVSRHANLFHAICGGTSTEALAKQFNAALVDPSIHAIALYVDSPGGEANGIHELAEMIYSARGKGKKIIAYVAGMGASAACWIATAADEVVIDATGSMGSIGVVQTMRFKKDAADVETLELVSAQSPLKRADPRTKEGRALYQEQIDYMAEVFVGRVSTYRGVARDKVVNDFGQGGMLMGQQAVDAGLADRLGSFEGVITELMKGKSSMSKSTGLRASTIAQSISLSQGMSVADAITSLKEVAPEVVAALAPEAVETSMADLGAIITAGDVPAFVAGASDEVKAALKAAFAPEAPALASAHAADIVKRAAEAGIPGLSASLIQEGVTLDSANSTIALSYTFRDTLAAAGMDGSLETMLSAASDPSKLLAVAIQEAQAKEADNGLEPETKGKAEKEAFSAADIYADRAAA